MRPSSFSEKLRSVTGAAPSEALQRHLHAGGGAAVGGVENVGAEVSHAGSLADRRRAGSCACVAQQSVYTSGYTQAPFPWPARTPRPAAFALPRARKCAAADCPSPADASAAGPTQRIVDSITTAIVERRLMPGTKLAEQQIADIFGVSRTLVRQALNQLSRDRLVTLEPARGAFVAKPSVQEARQVFEVRAMLEAAIVKQLCAVITDAQIAELRSHMRAEGPGGGAHRRVGPHPAAGRLSRGAGAHARQPGAGRTAGRPADTQLADRADVPVVPFGRTFAGRA